AIIAVGHCGRANAMRRLGGIGVVIAMLLAAPGRAQTPAGPNADEVTLSKAQVGGDGASLIAYFKSRMVSEPELRRIQAIVRQLGDDSYAVRERATGELIAAGLPAVAPLRLATKDPDVEIARRAERCLKKIERVPLAVVSAAAARVIAQ